MHYLEYLICADQHFNLFGSLIKSITCFIIAVATGENDCRSFTDKSFMMHLQTLLQMQLMLVTIQYGMTSIKVCGRHVKNLGDAYYGVRNCLSTRHISAEVGINGSGQKYCNNSVLYKNP